MYVPPLSRNVPTLYHALMSASSRGSIKAIFAVLLLCGFPLFFVDAALEYLLRLQRENLEKSAYARMDSLLDRCQSEIDPDRFFPAALRRIIARSERAGSKHSLQTLSCLLLRCLRFHPNLFTFTVFDHRDRLVYSGDGPKGRAIPERLVKALRSSCENGTNDLTAQEDLFAPWIGCSPRQASMISQGSGWMIISNQPRRSWFFTHIGRDFSLFAHVHKEAVPPMLGLQSFLGHPNRDGIELRLVDLPSLAVTNPHANAPESLVDRIIGRFERELTPHFREEGSLWSVRLLDARFRLTARLPDTPGKGAELTRIAFRTSVLPGIILGMLAAVWLVTRPTLPWISISWKLSVVFLASTGLPLSILAFTAFAYLDQREKGLMQDSWRRSTEMLRSFDTKMATAGKQSETRLQAIIASARLDSPKGLASFTALLADFRRRFSCREFVLLDRAGKEERLYEGPSRRDGNRMLIAILRAILRIVNGEKEKSGPPDQDLAQADLFFAGTMEGEIRSFIEGAAMNLGRIVVRELGPVGGYTYLDVIRLPDRTASHILAGSWDKSAMIRLFLSRSLPFKPLDDGTEILAIKNAPEWKPRLFSSGDWIRGRVRPPGQIIFRACPSRPISPSLRTFILDVLRTHRVTYSLIQYKDFPYLATGIPGIQVQGYTLFAMVPITSIREEIGAMRQNLSMFALLSLGFTLFLGFLLTAKFLEPVQALSKGVEAARTKDFQYRIPQHDPDEFGDLAILFNRMLEGLHEVSMGRQVQERLFPHVPLESRNYRVFGLSKPASELGGDIIEYIPFGNHGILVLTGDVTGHGIPAALVMAMSKAVIASFSARTAVAPDITEILATLNRVIFQTMKRSLFMTLSALWIDTQDDTLTLYNYGHPYPFFRRTTGEMYMVVASGLPIGVRDPQIVTPVFLQMNPGDRLIFYTDGLAESLDIGENLSGFDALEDYLRKRPMLSLQDSCRDILDNHPHVLAGVSQIDDLTVLIVEKFST
ncbi:MAG: SpoIIE family protein phosphatase [Candidatus Ozemobacteraceae bacterium]